MLEPEETKDFIGTKIALINEGRVLSTLRDDKAGIDFPGMWDFPGGARESGETPFQTVAREVKEELGITITQNEVVWGKVYLAAAYPDEKAVFMVINITNSQLKTIIFGDEGQEWKMMAFEQFINHKNAVPGMQTRLRDFLALSKFKEDIPIFTIHLPEYKVDTEPDHKVVGKVVDDEIKKHFMSQTILLRALTSVEHPGKSIDEMIEIIKRDGTDRYDPNRVGDRYENVENKHIDFFALRFEVTKDSAMFSQLTWPFYHWGIEDRGFPLRCDILIIYNSAQLKQIEFTYAGRKREGKRNDGFVFTDPKNKPVAIKAIFKIT